VTWSNHYFPKVPFPNSITLGVKVSTSENISEEENNSTEESSLGQRLGWGDYRFSLVLEDFCHLITEERN
jgi:hypothetical protein